MYRPEVFCIFGVICRPYWKWMHWTNGFENDMVRCGNIYSDLSPSPETEEVTSAIQSLAIYLFCFCCRKIVENCTRNHRVVQKRQVSFIWQKKYHQWQLYTRFGNVVIRKALRDHERQETNIERVGFIATELLLRTVIQTSSCNVR